MGHHSHVHLDVSRILRETQAAILCLLDSGREVWIPFSQMIEDDSDPENYKAGDTNCTITVKGWWANKEGLAGD